MKYFLKIKFFISRKLNPPKPKIKKLIEEKNKEYDFSEFNEFGDNSKDKNYIEKWSFIKNN